MLPVYNECEAHRSKKFISLTFSIYLIINNPIDIYFKNRIFSSVILPSVFMVLPHIDSSLIEGKNVLDIKRITFILQNIILNLLSIYKNEVVLKLAINVIYRITPTEKKNETKIYQKK